MPRQGEALSEFAFLIRALNARIFRVALRQEQAAVVGGERRASGGRQGGVELLPQGGALLSERTCATTQIVTKPPLNLQTPTMRMLSLR